MNREEWEAAFEKWSIEHWGINVDPSEVEKMIWLAACEYMESEQLGKADELDGSFGVLLKRLLTDSDHEEVNEVMRDLMLMGLFYKKLEKKLDTAVEALEKLSLDGEGTHGSRKCSSYDSLDDMQIEYTARKEVAKEALKQIKGEE